ncbi:hypothetical protein O181_095499 [Austropuccinia psidii MF-1]|uniref:Uncharacterized protein n=1 Tax=Austropuccinia psidii MF-1 TaxID=1389203 RepID=A0A9Q3PBT2_9BASI|nr:hypothetical protein [Austropuccinia psidii MF-1]
MLKEGQIILTSYSNILSVINSCFKIQHLWNPYVQSISTGSYLVFVLRSSPFKVGGTVITTGNTPPNWCSRKDKPSPIYGQLEILSTLGQLTGFVVEWPYPLLIVTPGPQSISCIIFPFCQLLISQPPG